MVAAATAVPLAPIRAHVEHVEHAERDGDPDARQSRQVIPSRHADVTAVVIRQSRRVRMIRREIVYSPGMLRTDINRGATWVQGTSSLVLCHPDELIIATTDCGTYCGALGAAELPARSSHRLWSRSWLPRCPACWCRPLGIEGRPHALRMIRCDGDIGSGRPAAVDATTRPPSSCSLSRG